MAVLFDVQRAEQTIQDAHDRFYEIQNFIVDRLRILELTKKQFNAFFKKEMGISQPIIFGNMRSTGSGVKKDYSDGQYLIIDVLIKNISAIKGKKLFAENAQKKFNDMFNRMDILGQDFKYDLTNKSITLQILL